MKMMIAIIGIPAVLILANAVYEIGKNITE